jgi:hypothetical protein
MGPLGRKGLSRVGHDLGRAAAHLTIVTIVAINVAP